MHRIAHRIAASATAGAVLLAAFALSSGTLPLLAPPALAQGAGQTGQSGAPATGQGSPPSIRFGGAAPPPAAPGLETRQFQDWTVRCGSPAPGAPDACEMVQQPQNDQGQTVLAVVIGKIANTNDLGMLIILPLGIWLPPGAVLKVDDGEGVPARIERCERHGCHVELPLEPKVLSILKAGRKANVLFQIYDENGKPKVVGVPFSLLGFTAALNEITA